MYHKVKWALSVSAGICNNVSDSTMVNFNMLFLSSLFFLCFISFQVEGNVGNQWGYKAGISQKKWSMVYPTCAGKKQSPINIDTSRVVLDPDLTPFDFSGVRRINKAVMTLENHGKTVEVDLEDKDSYILGGGLRDKYRIKQYHFHWGTADKRGSEHDCDGRQYPMEMHIVSYNTKYHDFKEAMNATGGLAVMSFLIDIGRDNKLFDNIIASVTEIIRADQNVTMQNFPFISLLPKKRDVYYRYYGSLTTPPCYESVIWSVFQTPMTISKTQIQKFRLLGSRYINKRHDIADNFRDIQNMNGRYVFTNDISGITPKQNKSAKKSILIRSKLKRIKQRTTKKTSSIRKLLHISMTRVKQRQFFKRKKILNRKYKRNRKYKDDLVNPFILHISNQIKKELLLASKSYPILNIAKPVSSKYGTRKITQKIPVSLLRSKITPGKSYGVAGKLDTSLNVLRIFKIILRPVKIRRTYNAGY